MPTSFIALCLIEFSTSRIYVQFHVRTSVVRFLLLKVLNVFLKMFLSVTSLAVDCLGIPNVAFHLQRVRFLTREDQSGQLGFLMKETLIFAHISFFGFVPLSKEFGSADALWWI